MADGLRGPHLYPLAVENLSARTLVVEEWARTGTIAYSKEPVKNLDMCPKDRCRSSPRFYHCSSEARTNPSMPTQRFLQLTEVSEILNISAAQAYALVRSGELPAIKVGGRGQWRVETTELENYIQRMYSETRQFAAAHPFGTGTDDIV